jgi:hypothetical protein
MKFAWSSCSDEGQPADGLESWHWSEVRVTEGECWKACDLECNPEQKCPDNAVSCGLGVGDLLVWVVLCQQHTSSEAGEVPTPENRTNE